MTPGRAAELAKQIHADGRNSRLRKRALRAFALIERRLERVKLRRQGRDRSLRAHLDHAKRLREEDVARWHYRAAELWLRRARRLGEIALTEEGA